VDQAGSYERPVSAPLVRVKLRGGTGPVSLYRSDVRPFLKEILEEHRRLGVQSQEVSLAALCVRLVSNLSVNFLSNGPLRRAQERTQVDIGVPQLGRVDRALGFD
jgi:hypothetical protein